VRVAGEVLDGPTFPGHASRICCRVMRSRLKSDEEIADLIGILHVFEFEDVDRCFVKLRPKVRAEVAVFLLGQGAGRPEAGGQSKALVLTREQGVLVSVVLPKREQAAAVRQRPHTSRSLRAEEPFVSFFSRKSGGRDIGGRLNRSALASARDSSGPRWYSGFGEAQRIPGLYESLNGVRRLGGPACHTPSRGTSCHGGVGPGVRARSTQPPLRAA